MLKFPNFFFFCACGSSKTAKKAPERCHFFKFFNRSSDLFEFYRSDLQANAKKSEKKFMRVLRRKKKVVSLQSQTNGKVSDWKRVSFGSSLKEWNGCSKQLEDFFETQR